MLQLHPHGCTSTRQLAAGIISSRIPLHRGFGSGNRGPPRCHGNTILSAFDLDDAKKASGPRSLPPALQCAARKKAGRPSTGKAGPCCAVPGKSLPETVAAIGLWRRSRKEEKRHTCRFRESPAKGVQSQPVARKSLLRFLKSITADRPHAKPRHAPRVRAQLPREVLALPTVPN